MLSLKKNKRVLLAILFIIFLSSITIFALGDVEVEGDLESAVVDGFEIINENQYLNLYVNKETTEFAVQDKNTGEIWYSNPPDRDEMEVKVRGSSLDAMASQLSFSYYTESDRERSMDSYNDSVRHGQFTIENIENGFRVDYQFGREWEDKDYMPTIVSKETFDTVITKNLSESDASFLEEQFILVNMVEVDEDYEHPNIFGVDSEEVFGNYAFEVLSEELSNRERRNLIQDIIEQIAEARDYSGVGSVTFEDLENFINNPSYIRKSSILPWDKERILEVVMESGYTPEKLQEEHMNFNFPIPYQSLRIFEIGIEYVLEDQDLIVRVPGDSIKYPERVMDLETDSRVSFPLTSLNVLPYFDGANQEKEGYILVPDGSGALINLNSDKASESPYDRPVYGRDFSRREIPEYKTYLNQNIYMPVFGINQGERGFLAIIEEGDAIADINALVAGMRDSYNRAYSSFSLIPHVRERITSVHELRNLAINMYQDRKYNGDIKIRYKLLQDEKTDYSSMANVYQEHLVNKHDLSKIKDDQEIPFFLELIGGVDRTVPVMGVQRRVVEPLTTYDQASKIVSEFRNNDINNIVLKYSGWSEGGYKHYYPSKAKLEGKLGNREDFEELRNSLLENNVSFIPDISFMNVYRTKFFDGYSARNDNARALNRNQAFIFDQHNLATFRAEEEERKYILSPNSLEKLVESFMDKYSDYDVPAISLRYMGEMLNSDYRIGKNTLVDREEAKNIIVDQLAELQEELDILINGGNAYTLASADYLLNMPVYSDSNVIIDEAIPFYQMVVHGYVQYSGNPINLSERPDTYPLKLMEIGANPYYQLSYEDSTILKQSDYEDLFSIYYQDYIDEAVSYYKDANEVLREVQSLTISKHEKLRDGVYKTTYENGSEIIVNYNQDDVTINEVTINAESYKYLRKGDVK